MIRKHLPGKGDILNYQASGSVTRLDLGRTVGKAVILVSLCLAFFVTNPVADVFFDDPESAYQRIMSPLSRGDSGVCQSKGTTHPALSLRDLSGGHPSQEGKSCYVNEFFGDD